MHPQLNEILHELGRIPGVSSTRTLVVLKTEKETSTVTLTGDVPQHPMRRV